MWRIWKYALGSFSDDKTEPYDNRVAIIRTFWVFVHLTTSAFIIIGNGRVLGFW